MIILGCIISCREASGLHVFTDANAQTSTGVKLHIMSTGKKMHGRTLQSTLLLPLSLHLSLLVVY